MSARCKYPKNESKAGRTHSFDTLKAILALMVVFLHVPHTTEADKAIDFSCRIAVPLFFMITGYYIPIMFENGVYVKHLRKIFRITAYTMLIYLVYRCIQSCFLHSLDPLRLTFEKVFNFFVLNLYPYNSLAWYFFALLYALVCILYIHKYNKTRLLYIATPLLIGGGWGLTFTDFYPGFQNFLFFGLPYISIGMMLRDGWLAKLANLRTITLWTFFVAMTVLAVAEFLLYQHTGKQTHVLYLCLSPLCITIFLLCLRYPNFGHNTLFAWIGEKCSAHIYIWHGIFVGKLSELILNKAGVPYPPQPVVFALAIWVFLSICSSVYVKTVRKRFGKNSQMTA